MACDMWIISRYLVWFRLATASMQTPLLSAQGTDTTAKLVSRVLNLTSESILRSVRNDTREASDARYGSNSSLANLNMTISRQHLNATRNHCCNGSHSSTGNASEFTQVLQTAQHTTTTLRFLTTASNSTQNSVVVASPSSSIASSVATSNGLMPPTRSHSTVDLTQGKMAVDETASDDGKSIAFFGALVPLCLFVTCHFNTISSFCSGSGARAASIGRLQGSQDPTGDWMEMDDGLDCRLEDQSGSFQEFSVPQPAPGGAGQGWPGMAGGAGGLRRQADYYDLSTPR